MLITVSAQASCEVDQGHTTILGPVSCMPNTCSAEVHDTGRMVIQAIDERLHNDSGNRTPPQFAHELHPRKGKVSPRLQLVEGGVHNLQRDCW